MKLKNINAIVTGANQGFGLVIAKEYVSEGAQLLICARDKTKLDLAVAELKTLAKPGQKILGIQADVSKEADVERLVQYGISELKKIDVLVNNAGVYGPKGLVEDVASNEWTKAIEINLFGVLYTCKHILPHMKKNHSGKIINLSGGGATSPMPRISAYAASKAAVVRLTETLALECKDNNIFINAIAPGALNTNLLDEILKAGPQSVGTDFYEKALKQKEEGGASMENAAKLCVYLASHEGESVSGKLISAVWDPWQDLATYRETLRKSDIYTLRRIIPQDRGQDWGKGKK
jgi:NAD(P)-dependent dehydrogenase (short-subunit alcohol dehydrogenase family)